MYFDAVNKCFLSVSHISGVRSRRTLPVQDLFDNSNMNNLWHVSAEMSSLVTLWAVYVRHKGCMGVETHVASKNPNTI